MSAVSATVCRNGTAITVDGTLLRRVDLPILGAPGPDTPRFVSVEADDQTITVELSDGTRESLPRASLRPEASRAAGEKRATLVVGGIGRLVTADGEDDSPLGELSDAAVVCAGNRIVWCGPEATIERCGYDLKEAVHIDAGGRLATPGLVDCHAHPMFAGNRADEFAMRAAGKGYLEIAAAGGGINATLEPTRNASFDEHVALTFARMERALAAGTTTCEAKSGYDLTVAGELRLLEVAQAVDSLSPVDLDPTLLGAHLVPPEKKNDRDTYVREIVEEMIPRAAESKLARAVDVYCDDGAFTLAETRAILSAAAAHRLALRGHVGQFADLGGAELLAELGGLSADHLECVSAAGIAALAAQSVVAVMLPGACVQLNMTPPPVAELRAAGVKLAVASDMNPGTTMGETLPLQMWLAATRYGMTVDECWLGVTRYAARAIGRHDIGVVTPGAMADLVIWDAHSTAEIPYRYDANLVSEVVKAGRPVSRRS